MSKEMHIVGFRVGREVFGVPIALVHEIVRVPEITSVPDSPGCVQGVINLRGKIVSVVDLRRRFGEKKGGDFAEFLHAGFGRADADGRLEFGDQRVLGVDIDFSGMHMQALAILRQESVLLRRQALAIWNDGAMLLMNDHRYRNCDIGIWQSDVADGCVCDR